MPQGFLAECSLRRQRIPALRWPVKLVLLSSFAAFRFWHQALALALASILVVVPISASSQVYQVPRTKKIWNWNRNSARAWKRQQRNLLFRPPVVSGGANGWTGLTGLDWYKRCDDIQAQQPAASSHPAVHNKSFILGISCPGEECCWSPEQVTCVTPSSPIIHGLLPSFSPYFSIIIISQFHPLSVCFALLANTAFLTESNYIKNLESA